MRFNLRHFSFVLGMALCFALRADARLKEKVLFIGSSTIGHWTTLEEDFPEVQPVNEGVNGTTFTDLIESVPELMAKHLPDRVVIYSGDNDLARGDDPAAIVGNFAAVVRLLRENRRPVEIDVISIKPSPARETLLPAVQETNALLAPAARSLQVTYIDTHHAMLNEQGRPHPALFDDSEAELLHMNEKGYRLWKEIVRPYLQRPFSF